MPNHDDKKHRWAQRLISVNIIRQALFIGTSDIGLKMVESSSMSGIGINFTLISGI
jgi:hypothetical protein